MFAGELMTEVAAAKNRRNVTFVETGDEGFPEKWRGSFFVGYQQRESCLLVLEEDVASCDSKNYPCQLISI